MIIGVTGSRGFVGKRFRHWLAKHMIMQIYPIASSKDIEQCDLVVHLAGMNRSDDQWELFENNIDCTLRVASACARLNRRVIFASSTYPHKSHYRASKYISEQVLKGLGDNGLLNFTVLRIPKIIGPGCKPHYNSFVSTILYSIAKGEPFEHLIKNKEEVVDLVHVDNVCSEFIRYAYSGPEFVTVKPSIVITLKEIIEAAKLEGNTFSKLVEWYRNNAI